MTKTYHQLRLDYTQALTGFLGEREASAEAVRCFEEGLGKSRSWMAAHGGTTVPPAQEALLAGWLARRKQGEPLAYILGWTPWRGRHFAVTPDALIPRPETELLLEAALDIGKRLKARRAVDVGTGTGILAITLALETDWEITATDISPKALGLARQNAEKLEARIEFLEGDLLSPVPEPLGLVISNPPYIDPADAPSLQRELAFEPPEALFAPEAGLACCIALLGQSKRREALGCLLEIGAGQGEILQAHARQFGWKRVQVHKDLAGHDRVLMAL